jgi:hypothetical protein
MIRHCDRKARSGKQSVAFHPINKNASQWQRGTPW